MPYSMGISSKSDSCCTSCSAVSLEHMPVTTFRRNQYTDQVMYLSQLWHCAAEGAQKIPASLLQTVLSQMLRQDLAQGRVP